MTLNELCKKLELPVLVKEQVLKYETIIEQLGLEPYAKQLFSVDTRKTGLAEIQKRLGEDTQGFKILSCFLSCALKTWEFYEKKGIGEDIFIATMKCFPRFIQEHLISYGSYGFDREWWVARQISMQLLRIGELEYEMKKIDGKPIISLHIPSDALLTSDCMRQSYQSARNLFASHFPEYSSAEMICDSWLLSPALRDLLPESSHIMQFQRAFTIIETNFADMEFMQWVFKNPKLPMEKLPENTSLQKNMKKYLMEGGKVGSALGILREPGFEHGKE